MEYVEGQTLRDVLKSQGHLPVRRAMEIVADVCGALDFSHRNGIVHRDIKPANVMITQSGAVKVMDFGIARALADNAATVTQTASVIGTAQYLSPEQARGEAVDARSDVYSTGCLLYELVAGSPPFQGDSPVAVAYQHVRENAAPPSTRNPEVPPALDSIVMKALAKNQLNRYQSAGEMRTDLQRALANQPVAAEAVMSDADRTQFIARTPPPPVAVPHRDGDYARQAEDQRRSSLIWVAVVAALLLVIGAGTYAIFVLGKDDNKTKKVAVPSVIGQLPSAAADRLTKAGFKPRQAEETTSGPCDDNQKVPEGNVCTVTPKGGLEVEKGSTVTYALYKPATKQVPYVVGKQYADAVNDLHDAGLKAGKKDVDGSEPAGTVLDQSKPQFSEVPAGAKIILSVSTGQVKLPDVRTKKRDDAISTLNSAQFTHVNADETVDTGNKGKDGTVADESPTPGIAYPLSTTITLKIYHYVPPAPTCTTPPATPTETATPTTPPPGSPTPTPTPTGSGTGLPPCTS
jgi:eukaryotic-like serine/threonine-protein kinase